MPVSKYYHPDANLTLTAKYSDNKSLTRGTNEKQIGMRNCFGWGKFKI